MFMYAGYNRCRLHGDVRLKSALDNWKVNHVKNYSFNRQARFSCDSFLDHNTSLHTVTLR